MRLIFAVKHNRCSLPQAAEPLLLQQRQLWLSMPYESVQQTCGRCEAVEDQDCNHSLASLHALCASLQRAKTHPAGNAMH